MAGGGTDSSWRSRWWPAEGDGALQWFVELLGVGGLLVAQPIYEIYRDGADVFVWQRADDEILWWALAVLVLPPLAVHLPGAIARRAHLGTGRALHAAGVGLLCGLLAARTLAHATVDPDTGTTTTVAMALGLGATAVGLAGLAVVAWYRWRPFRSWLRLVALAPLVLCASFLASSPIREIAFGEGTGATVALDLEDPPPILVIVFDELPLASMLGEDDLIDADLLPAFARLAETATLHRNTSTVSPSSPTAVPALLSGRYPTDGDVPPIADEYPENLFTLLASTYRLNVWESVAQLCPPDRCDTKGQPASVPHLLREAADAWLTGFVPDPSAEQEPYKPPQSQPKAPRTFEAFTESIRTGGAPQLDFLHIILPHQPWYHLPSGAEHDGPFLTPGLVGGTYAWGDDFVAQAGRQRHLLQLVRTDELLGELLDRMEAAGTFDETLIVVTADHGVAFEDGEPIRGVSAGNYEQVMWVPLIVKEPGQRDGRIDDTPARTIDVLPTIAHLLGTELPWRVDGVALDDPRPADVEDRRMLEWRFNALEPAPGEHYVTVDGVEGFARLLAQPPATEPGDDPLKPWRFGRWGSLIGLEAEELLRADALDVEVTLHPPADEACHADRSTNANVVPAYLCVTMDDDEPRELLFSVNGYVGGWGRTRPTKVRGERVGWALVPEDLLVAGGQDEVEVFQIVSDLSAPHGARLAPVELVDPATG